MPEPPPPAVTPPRRGRIAAASRARGSTGRRLPGDGGPLNAFAEGAADETRIGADSALAG
ncbi:hypothetical protein [Streptomyces sp. NPDC057413]|uniref:hypothetical protein n=1 Tax=Streptomyces sp. NPDC057413 TaxID=3346124 RepID=UPI0036C0B47B